MMDGNLWLNLYVLFIAIAIVFALRGGEGWDATDLIFQLTVAFVIMLTLARIGAAYWSTFVL